MLFYICVTILLYKCDIVAYQLCHSYKSKKTSLLLEDWTSDFLLWSPTLIMVYKVVNCYFFTLGSVGTVGRVCNTSSLGSDGCDIMCCGRGYDTKRVKVEYKCECKFHWCCEVKCQDCEKWEDVHTCKGPTPTPSASAVRHSWTKSRRTQFNDF